MKNKIGRLKCYKIAATAVVLTMIVQIPSDFSALQELSDCQISNDYLKCTVEQDGNSPEYLRFNLDTDIGAIYNEADDDKSLLYKNFFTGYTTIGINGVSYVYGTGTDVSKPYVDEENKHISTQNFNVIEVQQELSFDKGLTDLYDDMLKVSYTVKNNGEDAEVGIRIMLDPSLDNDDSCILKIDGIEFTGENEFSGETVPKIWSIESSKYTEIQAYGKITDDCVPDKMIYADWDAMYNNRWDYNVNVSNNVSDSAVAFIWEQKTLSQGESITYTVYYGVKNTVKIEESSIEESYEETNEASNVKSDDNETYSSDASNSSDITASESINDTDSINTGYVFPIFAVIIAVVSGLVVIIFARKRGVGNEK